MNTADTRKLAFLKAMVLTGRASEVSAKDKQWILDTLNNAGIPIRAAVIKRAKNSGFDTEGLRSL